MRQFHHFFVILVASAVVAAGCGTEPTQQTGNGGFTSDTSGGDTQIGFGDTTTGGDSTGGDTTTGDDSTGGDTATGGDSTSGDSTGGCERDADCADLSAGVCQAPKCNLQTGQCFVAEEDDGTVCDDGDPCTSTEGVCKAGKCEASAIDCDDGNPCTTDTCDAASGCKHSGGGDGATCDDGNACTEKDACNAEGACAGTLIACDDNNPCTVDSCDPQNGCVGLAADGGCDDGDACTENDACAEGKCAATAVTCDDGNPCTDDSCDKTDGCKATAKSGACEDGNACTSGDSCDDKGACIPGTAADCDDGNACTEDACDAIAGCTHTALADDAQCDDGTACTTGDACKAGKCEGTALVCDDNEACTNDSCDKEKGCVNAADDSLTCDDGDACTGSDACKDGKCAGTPVVDCDDNNPCTTDSCDTATKGCTNEPNTAACDDGDACTQGDVCADKACKAGTAIACDDGNPCTDDVCDKTTGACAQTPNTAACDDNDACTDKDACKDGVCAGGPKSCDDGKPCTADSCDAAKRASVNVAVADDTACDDGSLCTSGDVCAAGACKGTKVACDDGNPCTDDSCDKAKGCLTKANTDNCDDGNACSSGDVCKDGVCLGGSKALKCDDGNPCTDDACDKEKGCIATNNAANCDDGNACTENDACTEGQCLGSKVSCADQNACTTDKCDEKTGCSNTPNTNKCSDSSVCTEGDVCDGKGACKPGAAIKCDDGNACTTDTCDAKKGCTFTPVKTGTACDDGNACTDKDVCDAEGKCAGAGKSCDDGNPCTVDSCANNVCANKPAPKDSACDDGDSCTQKDACDAAGKCVGSNPVKCDDNNPCTDDVCVNGQGCKSTANTKACDDGKWCTEGDVCKDAKCTSGKPKVCDDGNSCTSDICDEIKQACAKFPKLPGTPCDDGNLCSTGDACDNAGSCKSNPVACDDDNPCTTDACDTKTGKCTFTIGTVCAKRPIPDLEEIGYLDADWHLTNSDTAIKWTADNNPNPPGALNNGAALNFNNGKDYNNSKVVKGTALTKYLYDASKVQGAMTLAFSSYNGVENSSSFDDRVVEVSTDGFATTALSTKLDNSKHRDVWWLETIDLSQFKGKVFQVRFRFDTKDTLNNTGKGWFVDNVAIYAGPVVKVSAATAWDEAFNAANAFGWHFSAKYGDNASVWALDKTSSSVGGYTGESMNFNDGVDFNNGTSKAYGWALSPVVDLTGVTSGSVTLLFKSWYDGEASQNYDQRFVEVSSLAFGGAAEDVKVQMQNADNLQDGWRWEWIDLTKFKGKKIRLRFVFDSKDTVNNTGKGWFVDDLRIDNAPLPVFGDMITLANKSAWTINNAQSPVGWNIDTTGIAPLSKNGSLNFNGYNSATKGYDYLCPAGKTSVTGTATSQPFTVTASSVATAKYMLTFEAYLDLEGLTGWDIVTVEVVPTNPADTTKVSQKLAKTDLDKWAAFSFDVTALKGKQVNIRFLFDSVDCNFNDKKGVAIENVMVRADK